MAQSLPPELALITDFLSECLPFNTLPREVLEQTASCINVAYYRQGHCFEGIEDEGGLRIIRSGAAELRENENQLVDRLDEGESFNLKGLCSEKPDMRAMLIEDSLLYLLAEEDYQQLRKQYRDIDRFFHSQRGRRIRRAARHEPNPSELMQPVSRRMSTEVLQTDPQTPIQQAAQMMTEQRVSSILVTADAALQGIVTDRDIRSRAVAKGLSLDTAISDIMTADPLFIDPDATLFDTTLLMTRTGIHHLPVVKNSKVTGIITASDLLLAKQDDPIYLVQHISRQNSVADIANIVSQLPNLLAQWSSSGTRAHQIGHILTAISDAVLCRLIDCYIKQHGPAPVPFCWLGFGSQGRREQLLGADQDNGLLISDQLQPEHEDWFEGLAKTVCDGLNQCGYVYCPGEIMAMTDQWRQPLKVWKETVDRWTRTPTTDAVMRVSIFFDLRGVYGDTSLAEQLQQHMLDRAASNTIFLAALAANVLDTPPPLGIFRRFVVDHDGEHRDELDLKKRGVLPIVDIVRIHALGNRIPAVNTLERIRALVQQKVVTVGDGRNLEDAYRIIQQIRVSHQGQEIVSGSASDNYIDPRGLSKLVRKQLRDAFTVVENAQQGVRLKYRQGLG